MILVHGRVEMLARVSSETRRCRLADYNKAVNNSILTLNVAKEIVLVLPGHISASKLGGFEHVEQIGRVTRRRGPPPSSVLLSAGDNSGWSRCPGG
jgi:hypothetical protein